MSTVEESGEGRRTLVLVDDERATLDAFEAILRRHAPHLDVVDTITDGRAAVDFLRARRPDVALLDLHMPSFGGLDVLRSLAPLGLATKVLILTAFEDRSLVTEALRAGADGYLLKTSTAEQIVRAIDGVLSDDLPLSPEIVRILAGVNDCRSKLPSALTPREEDVLRALADGLSNREIAERLHLAESTVKQYVGTLGDKLGVRTRTQILVAAARQGLLTW